MYYNIFVSVSALQVFFFGADKNTSFLMDTLSKIIYELILLLLLDVLFKIIHA